MLFTFFNIFSQFMSKKLISSPHALHHSLDYKEFIISYKSVLYCLHNWQNSVVYGYNQKGKKFSPFLANIR